MVNIIGCTGYLIDLRQRPLNFTKLVLNLNGMRVFVLIHFLLGASLFCFGQDGFSSIIDKDNGLAPFTIDAPKEKLTKYLISDSSVVPDVFCTSAYKVDYKLAGLNQFFGLAITDMRVGFDGELDVDGKASAEDIWSVSVKLTKPENDATKTKFMEALNTQFGPCDFMWDPDFTTVVRMMWWSDISMLYVHLGVNIETGEEQDFYTVSLHQAYGG